MHFRKARPHPERGRQLDGRSGENSAPSLHPSRTQAGGPRWARRGWKAWQGPGGVAGAPPDWRALRCHVPRWGSRWGSHWGSRWGSRWAQAREAGGPGLVLLPPHQPLLLPRPLPPPHPHSCLPTPRPPRRHPRPPGPRPPHPRPREADGQGPGSRAAVRNTRQVGERVWALGILTPPARDDTPPYLHGRLLRGRGLCGLRGCGHCLLRLPAVIVVTGGNRGME